jgi:hypothetical protein
MARKPIRTLAFPGTAALGYAIVRAASTEVMPVTKMWFRWRTFQ